MIQSNISSNISKEFPKINEIYFNHRQEIKLLLKNINNHLDNNSKTFFLALYYSDYIFSKYDISEIFSIPYKNNYNISDYVLLSLACLVTATKFIEIDPHIPDLTTFGKLCTNYSKYQYFFKISEILEAEVKIVKILEYKLNYFSLYHFITFFFAHGIILESTIIKNSNNKYSSRKLLEKIYVQSREILDIIVDNYNEYFYLIIGENNYITAVEILKFAIEYYLEIDLEANKKFDNIFYLIYDIDIPEDVHSELKNTIKKIYSNIKNYRINNNNKKFVKNNTTTDINHYIVNKYYNEKNNYDINNRIKQTLNDLKENKYNNNYYEYNKKDYTTTFNNIYNETFNNMKKLEDIDDKENVSQTMLSNNSNNLNSTDITKYKQGASYYFNSIENDSSLSHFNDISSLTADLHYANKYSDKKFLNNINNYSVNTYSTNLSTSNKKPIIHPYNSFSLNNNNNNNNNNKLESKDLYKKYLGMTKYNKETDNPIMINDENFLSKTKKIFDESELRNSNEKEENNGNTIIINNNIQINAFIDKKNDWVNYYKNRFGHTNNKYNNNSKYYMSKKNSENYGIYHDNNNRKFNKIKEESYKSTDTKALKYKYRDNSDLNMGDIKTYYNYGSNYYSNSNNISKYTESSNVNDSNYNNNNNNDYDRFKYLNQWKKIENEVGKNRDMDKKINTSKKYGKSREFYNF